MCLCALSPIGLKGGNAECWQMYSTRAWKVENISVRTIYCWNLCFIGFMMIQPGSRSKWGFRRNVKNVTFISRKMDFFCTRHSTPYSDERRWRHYRWQASTVQVHYYLLRRRVCKRVDVYMITLSCTWRIYALSERLLVITIYLRILKFTYEHTIHWKH